MEALDTDGNGSIDSEEFAAAFVESSGDSELQVSNLQGYIILSCSLRTFGYIALLNY